MFKYIKPVLVICLIAIFAALGVAGINYLTAPVIEKMELEKKMEAYLEIFPELDIENTQFIDSGFKSSYVKEKATVKDTNGELLGYGFNAKGKNTYGPISLVIGLDAEGSLIDLKLTENGQTGGRADTINTWVDDSYATGMTAEELQNLKTPTGATMGSKLVKDLVNACLAELGILTEVQENIKNFFPSFNTDNTKSFELIHYANQLQVAYTVKDDAKNLLGYYFVYKADADNTIEFALDANLNLMDKLTNNEDYDKSQVTALYQEVAKLEIGIANKTEAFNRELAVKLMYGDTAVMSQNDLEKPTIKDSTIALYREVKVGEDIVGHVVEITRTNTYGDITLFVGIADETLSSLFIVDAGQTAGKNAQLSEFISTFNSGLSGEEALKQNAVAGATFAANTVKDIIADAFEVVTKERPKLGYESQYKELFEGVVSTEDYKITINDENATLVEAKTLKDANGAVLGYGIVITGNVLEYSGSSVTILVGVQTTGKLQDVILIADNATGGYNGKQDAFIEGFTSGMGQADLDKVNTSTGATFTSKRIVSLIKLVLSSFGSQYESHYVKAFSNIDMNKSEFDSNFKTNRKELIEKIVAKDANGNVIGYGYVVELRNIYAYNLFLVALDTDGELITIVDIKNDHGSLDDVMSGEVGKKFPAGMSYDEVMNLQGIASSTYTIETIRLGILVAMEENRASDQTNPSEKVNDELIVKGLFSGTVWARTEKLTKFKNNNIYKAYHVQGVNGPNDGNSYKMIGYVYFLKVENRDVIIDLAIAINENNTYHGATILNWIQKDNQLNENIIPGVPTPSFGDTLRGRIETYLTTFSDGMNYQQVKLSSNLDRAYFTSETIKQAICLAINESLNINHKYDYQVYNYGQVFFDYIENIDISNSKNIERNANWDKNVLAGLEARNINNEFIAYAYIVENINIYSHNYVLVLLDKDNNLIKVIDIENNHGSLNQVEGYLNGAADSIDKNKDGKLDKDDIANLSYNIHDWDSTLGSDAHASFTIEQVKQIILFAMQANSNSVITDLTYEVAMKKLFPFAVYGRSINLKDLVSNKDIKYAYTVYGYQSYVDGVKLGNVLAFDDIMISMSNKGLYLGYTSISREFTSLEKSFLDQLKPEMTIDAIKNIKTDAIELKEKVVALMTEGLNFIEITDYDSFISDIFADFFAYNSKVINNFKTPLASLENDARTTGMITAVEVHNINDDLLGYAYIVQVVNCYSWHIMAVGLDKNNDLVKVVDVDNFHPGDGNKADITVHLESFITGMTYEQVLAYQVDPNAHGTFTREQINQAIKLAMFERENVEDKYYTQYEIAAKQIFNGMITTKSTEITSFKNKNILFGYKVYGLDLSQNPYNTTQSDLGYVYIVRVENAYSWHIMAVGLDNDNNLVKVVDVDNFHPGDGNKADITTHLQSFITGMTYEQVLAYQVDPNAHGTFTREQINLAIMIAMEENYNSSRGIYEVAAKTIFKGMVATKSTPLTEFKSSNILFGYEVYGLDLSENPYNTTQSDLGYAYAIEKDGKKAMIGLSLDGQVIAVYDLTTYEIVENNSEYQALIDIAIAELGGNN